MPVCPNCKAEYVEGITVCSDCGTELVDRLEEPVENREEDWEVIFTSNKPYEVDMMKDNLDGAGIASMILDQQDRNFPAPGDFSVIKLLVKKEDASAAEEFINKYNSEQLNDNEDELPL